MFPGHSDIIADTSAHPNLVGVFAFQVLADAVITTLVGGNLTGYVAKTLPAGQIIYCTFTSITLASGSIVLYRF